MRWFYGSQIGCHAYFDVGVRRVKTISWFTTIETFAEPGVGLISLLPQCGGVIHASLLRLLVLIIETRRIVEVGSTKSND
jgi:hypothetical protein